MIKRIKVIVITILFISKCVSQKITSKTDQLSRDLPLAGCNNWLGLPSQPSFVSIGDLDITGDQITIEAEFNRTTPYSGGFLYAAKQNISCGNGI